MERLITPATVARRHAAWLLIPIVLAVFAVYSPGLNGPFVFDDISNILRNPDVAVTELSYESLTKAAMSGQSGPLKRPLAMVSYALNYHAAGGFADTRPFKLTNLLIHTINVGLVLWFSWLLFTAMRDYSGLKLSSRALSWLALSIVTLWALHPINLTSVLYVVQRMTSLSALFLLAGLIAYLYGRKAMQQGSVACGFSLLSVGSIVGLVLGLASKENAALLPLFMLVIELTCFDRTQLNQPARRLLYGFFAIWLLAPLAAALIWIFMNPEFVTSGYTARNFTLPERFLTETRILWLYVGMLLVPIPGQLTLFHDDIPLSISLWSPWTTFVAIISWTVVIVVAIRYRRSQPVYSFAVLWFLAGHTLESSVLGLDLAHEHRNYLPSFGPLAGLVYAIHVGTQRLRSKAAPGLLLLLLAVTFATVTSLRAITWASEEAMIEEMVANHPRSAKSQAMMAELSIARRHDPARALFHYNQALALDPSETGLRLRIAAASLHPALPDQLRRAANQLLEATQLNGAPTTLAFPQLIRQDREGISLSEDFVTQTEVLLATRPFNPEARETIVQFSRCLIEQPARCLTLATPAKRWYAAIVRNPESDIELRRHARLVLFEVAVAEKNYPAAIQIADEGHQQEPTNTTYLLMRANSLILLKRYREAEHLLEEVSRHASGESAATISHLRDILVRRQTN